jgi:cytidylate kinase
MSIITISRGSYSRGKELAEKVAERVGYDCISRDILLEASEQFNIPEMKLVRAIHDAPSILDRFTYGREKYIAYFQAALLRYLREDNVVYHGLAGHFLVPRIAHVLRVRIIADIEDRVRLETEREGISSKEALRVLKKDDEQRRKWSLALYGLDTCDPGLYDLVIHIQRITVDDAVDIVCNTVKLEAFQTSPQSLKALWDLALAAEVKAALINLNSSVEVCADDGRVQVKTRSRGHSPGLADDLMCVARTLRGVKSVCVQELPGSFYGE